MSTKPPVLLAMFLLPLVTAALVAEDNENLVARVAKVLADHHRVRGGLEVVNCPSISSRRRRALLELGNRQVHV